MMSDMKFDSSSSSILNSGRKFSVLHGAVKLTVSYSRAAHAYCHPSNSGEGLRGVDYTRPPGYRSGEGVYLPEAHYFSSAPFDPGTVARGVRRNPPSLRRICSQLER